MRIQFISGYWTIVCNDQPVLACVSFRSAFEMLS
jgi:hypothetical protein